MTTRKAGWSTQNSASINGETLVWIFGNSMKKKHENKFKILNGFYVQIGFAINAFSMSPSTATSNKVILVGKYASFDCEIHVDKCTETQLTCWTP